MYTEIIEIQKELIPTCSFQKETHVTQNPDLMKQLNDATILGNSHRTKVEIIFCDDEGIKKVNTTIWATGTKYICLKGGVWIPISRIVEIKI